MTVTPGGLPPTATPGVLRIVAGTIKRGSERTFVSVVAERIAAFQASSPGLRGFAGGYQRSREGDRFVLVTFWTSEAAIALALGDPGVDREKAVALLGGLALVASVDHYEVLPPADGGLVDFSGGVIRLSRTTLRPDRLAAGYERLKRSGDDLRREHMLVAQYIGRRIVDERHEIVTASVWPSLAALEAFAGPTPGAGLLFPEMSGFLDDVAIEHYQTIEFGLGEASYRPPRRAIAVRFHSLAAAESATGQLREQLTLGEGDLVVAPLGRTGPGSAPSEDVVMVLRVVPDERFEAERLIADLDGEFLTSLA